jgi:hypothetical protein
MQREAKAVAELQAECVISSGKPTGAFGHTLHTLSVETPGLMSAIEASSHSRQRL